MSFNPWKLVKRFIPGTLVRADGVNEKLEGIEQSFTELDAIYKTEMLRLPAGYTASNKIPNKTLNNALLYFDANANLDVYHLATLDSKVQQAADSASAANSSAGVANNHAFTASNAAAAAANSKTQAEQAALNAASYRDGAEQHKNKASEFANGAANTEVEPGLFSSNHFTELAKKYANNNKGVVVETGLYSAKHWASIAQEHAAAAQGYSSGTANNSLKLNNQPASYYAKASDLQTPVPENAKFTDTHRAITDSLTSTSSSVSASAKAAKTLKDIIDSLSVANIEKSIGNPVSLGVVDLDTIIGAGVYYQGSNARASDGANYPSARAGVLLVYPTAGIVQVYREYATGQSYERGFYGSTWSAWAKVYSSNNKPNPSDIGALAVEDTAVNSHKLENLGLRDVIKQGVAHYYTTGDVTIDLDTDALHHVVTRWGTGSGTITLNNTLAQGGTLTVNNARTASGLVTLNSNDMVMWMGTEYSYSHHFTGRGKFEFTSYSGAGLMLTGAWEE